MEPPEGAPGPANQPSIFSAINRSEVATLQLAEADPGGGRPESATAQPHAGWAHDAVPATPPLVWPGVPSATSTPRLRPSTAAAEVSPRTARRASAGNTPPTSRPNSGGTPNRRLLGRIGAPVPSPSPQYRSMMGGGGGSGSTSGNHTPLGQAAVGPLAWSVDVGPMMAPRTPRTPAGGMRVGGVRTVVPLAQRAQRPSLRAPMTPSGSFVDLPTPTTPSGLGLRKFSGVGVPSPSPSARSPSPRLPPASPTTRGGLLAHLSPSAGGFVTLQLPPTRARRRGQSLSNAETLLPPADESRTPSTGRRRSASKSADLTYDAPWAPTTPVQPTLATKPLHVSASPVLSPSHRQLTLIAAAQAHGSPRMIAAAAAAATAATAAGSLTELNLTSSSAMMPATPGSTGSQSRSLTANPLPTHPSAPGSPLTKSTRAIGGPPVAGSSTSPSVPSPSRARHIASQHLLSTSPPSDYLRSPDGTYSVIREETQSHLNSSTTGGSRSTEPPQSAGISAQSRILHRAHSAAGPSSPAPQARRVADLNDLPSAPSPRTQQRTQRSGGGGGGGIGGGGSVISEYDPIEESHFFDELPIDYKSSPGGGAGSSGPGGKNTSGGRRLSDDYSTYKQKQVAARQDRKFQEKMRSQRTVNAGGGIHSRFLGGGALAEEEALPWCFIHPASTVFQVWKVLLILLVWYSCFETSFVVAFDIVCAFPRAYPSLVIMNVATDFAMVVDIWIYTRKGFYDETLELNSTAASIRRKYARSWLVPDLVAAMPLEFVQCLIIATTSAGASHPIVTSLPFQLLKLGRIVKMVKVIHFSETRQSMRVNETVRTFFAFVYLVLIGHLVACGWYLLARLEERANPNAYTWLTASNLTTTGQVDHYVFALYWALATLLSIGFGGHIAPVNLSEQVYTIGVVVFAALAYAQVIGNFMLVIENLNRSQSHHEQALSFLQDYMTRHRFPPGLERRVLDFQVMNYVYLNNNIGKHVYLRPEEEETYLRREEEARRRTLMRHQTLKEAKRQRAADAAAAAAAQQQMEAEDGGRYVVDEHGQELFLPFWSTGGGGGGSGPAPPPAVEPIIPGSSAWLEEAIEEFDCESSMQPSGAAGGANVVGSSSESHESTTAGGDGRLHERSEDRILSTLPACYSLEIMLHLHGRLIYNVFMFRDLNSSILSALTKELRTRLYVRDDFVTRRKLMGRRMYLVKRGVVERIEFSDAAKKIAMAARKKTQEEQQAREKKQQEAEGQRDSRSTSSQPTSFVARLLHRTTNTAAGPTKDQAYATLSANLLASKPTIRRHNEGFVFGESSFLHGYFDETVRVVSAVAEICVLEYASFLSISEAYPEFARCVLGAVEKRQELERARALQEQKLEGEREARLLKRKTERQQTANVRQMGSRNLHGDISQRSPGTSRGDSGSSLVQLPSPSHTALVGTAGGGHRVSPSHTSVKATGTGQSSTLVDGPRGSFAPSMTTLLPATAAGAQPPPGLVPNSTSMLKGSLHDTAAPVRPSVLIHQPPRPHQAPASPHRSRQVSDTLGGTPNPLDDGEVEAHCSEDSIDADQAPRRDSTVHLSMVSVERRQRASASVSWVETGNVAHLHRRSIPAAHVSTGPSYEEYKEHN